MPIGKSAPQEPRIWKAVGRCNSSHVASRRKPARWNCSATTGSAAVHSCGATAAASSRGTTATVEQVVARKAHRRDRGRRRGHVSEANRRAIEAAGLSFILGMKFTHVPNEVLEWRKAHPDKEIPDGHVFVQPWPPGPHETRRDQVIYYQYKADRARRTLRGIDEQIAEAQSAVDGKTPVKRNRFIQLTGATKTVNRALEAKARAVAGLKGYVTNLEACPDGTRITAEFVIDAYHRLFRIEQSFRMSKHDLQVRPIYPHLRD